MRDKPSVFVTDQRRFARAGRYQGPLAPPAAGDHAVFQRGPSTRATRGPLAASRTKGTVLAAPKGAVVAAAPSGAVANQLQAVAPGPAPGLLRAKTARGMSGIPYAQEIGLKLRASNTAEGLKYMDCSEFVARVLAAVGITAGVQSMNSAVLLTFLNDKRKFVRSDSPRVGDIALWGSHTGIVGAVGPGGTMKLIHAKGKGQLSGENFWAITPAQYHTGSIFYGYFRPVGEGGGGGPVSPAPRAVSRPATPAGRHSPAAPKPGVPKLATVPKVEGSFDPNDAPVLGDVEVFSPPGYRQPPPQVRTPVLLQELPRLPRILPKP